MAINDTQNVVELSKTVVGAGVPIACTQRVYAPEHVFVYYGLNRVQATYGVDYTVVLAGDFESYTLTPQASLITKLNNLGEGNNIKVVRIVPYENAMVTGDTFVRENLVHEFDLLSMRCAQMQWQLGFIPEDLATNIQEAVNAVALAEDAADAAAASAATATTQASNASTSAGAASASATAASGSASTASTQATNAAASASTASTQATNAANSASTASTQATNASNSATTASTQATNASNSATAAAASATAAATANAALSYGFSTTTADADPGAGTLRLNNAAPGSATAMYIDNLDGNAVDVTALLDTADDSTNTASKAIITLRSKTNPAIYAIYSLTGNVVDGTGYRKFTLTYVTGSGSFTNGMGVWLLIDRVGDKGAAGAGSGDALVANPLSQFAATTSAQLKSVISDETGSGALVFANSPALVTPTGIVKGDVGLGNVDNTSDATKNAAVATLTNKTLTSPVINTPTGIVKGDVGLGNVDNTSDATKNAAAVTLTNKTLTDPAIIGAIAEDVYTITDGAAFEIDPGNGTIQQITLGANRTPKGTNFAAGESITLHIDDGTAFTLTWTDATFGSGGVHWVGGSAPALATSGWSVVVLWKMGSQVYGKYIGDVAA